ncbi:MAG: mechanosensitive ion channel family protein [Chlamydiales bacterium]|nr:mechanosensitive ion channel family protein [Chlamydiales bacterium]
MSFNSLITKIHSELPWAFKVLVVLLIFTILHFILNLLFKKFIISSSHQKKSWQILLFHALYIPLILILWVFAGSIVLSTLICHIDKESTFPVDHLRTFLIVFCVTWFLLRWKKSIQTHLLSRTDDHAPDKVKVDILGKLISLFIILLATLFSLEALGFNIQTLIAIGGISGFSIGFAGKDVFANFFGGLMLYLTRPFVVGDLIKSSDKPIEGTVETISWYYTSIRGVDKQPIYVPNSLFSTILLTNLSRMSHWNIDERIGIRYDDIHSLLPIIENIKQFLNQEGSIDKNQPIRVYFDKLADSSLEIVIWACIFATKKDDVIPIKQKILLEVSNIVAAHHAEFAYPTRTMGISKELTDSLLFSKTK